MKKILLILAVLALAAPTMAAVSISVVDNGNCTGDITYSMTGEAGDQRVRAWALTVTVDGGAVITAVSPTVAGENDAVTKGFGFFPGTIVIVGGVIADPNTPVSPDYLPGAAGTGLGTDTVILEMSSLNVDSNFPPDTGTLATFDVDQACNVTITAEVQYRGGIVREDASEVIGATLPTNEPITCNGEPECVKSDSPMYSDWEQFGKPDCWCYEFQCKGDADGGTEFSGAVRVLTIDLGVLITAYGQPTGSIDAAKACADFDHLGEFSNAVRVLSNDLAAFVGSYGQPTANVTSCSMDWDGDTDDDYNFWIVP